jgi:hypothetical protein
MSPVIVALSMSEVGTTLSNQNHNKMMWSFSVSSRWCLIKSETQHFARVTLVSPVDGA